jgi:hypothetical protein
VDEKFLLAASVLPDVLALCAGGYRVLEVQGARSSRYSTTYYDTADLLLYHEHATGRLPRRKVRVRSYLDSGVTFLEIKRRDNRKRVKKARIEIRDGLPRGADRLADLPGNLVQGLSTETLREVVTTSFSRVTLVARTGAERVTIDTQLTFAARGAVKVFASAVCVEIKQLRHDRSAARDALRRLAHRPVSLSKYCVGVASVVEGAPVNSLKPMLRRLQRLERGGNPIVVSDT